MAGSGYDVDPAVLKTQGGVFVKLGDDFTHSANELKRTHSSTMGEWGSDDFIGTFKDFYEPVSEGITESMPHLGEEISRIGEKLKAMGDHYESTEQDQRDGIAKLAGDRPNLTT